MAKVVRFSEKPGSSPRFPPVWLMARQYLWKCSRSVDGHANVSLCVRKLRSFSCKTKYILSEFSVKLHAFSYVEREMLALSPKRNSPILRQTVWCRMHLFKDNLCENKALWNMFLHRRWWCRLLALFPKERFFLSFLSSELNIPAPQHLIYFKVWRS